MTKPSTVLARSSSAIDYRVQAVIDILKRDLAQNANWRKVSSSVGLSLSGLRLVFKRDTGVPPSKYLRRLRFERARELLCQKADKSVKEIMASVGFSDESHFVRDFRKMYGESPRAYRLHHFETRDPVQVAKKPTK